MLRKDYIVRQFEEFGKVMAVIFGLKRQQDWDKFEKELAVASEKFTSLEIDFVERLSVDDLAREVTVKELLPEQYKMLADLLYEKMNYYIQHGKSAEHFELLSKCLMLYQMFSQSLTQNEFNLDVHYKLEILKKIKQEL